METATQPAPAKKAPTTSAPMVESKKTSLSSLPDGLYLIARCIDGTIRREGEYADEKTGRLVKRVTYITGYRAEGATYEHTAYADIDSPADKPRTERGEPIELVPFGARVLFARSSWAKDKETGCKLVQKLSGKVLDVQS